MNQRRNSPRGRILAPAAAASLLVLLGACKDDPAGVSTDLGGHVSLDEVYEVDVDSDLQYGTGLDEDGAEEVLLLDLHQPRDDGDGLRPAVVWLHGGSFKEGHKGEMTSFARRTARRGYVAASANYRLREAGDFEYTDPEDEVGEEVKRNAQEDVQEAVRWLRANAEAYRIDPDEIFLVGYSAGGTAALRAAARTGEDDSSADPESEVSAVVAISGYLDEGVLENGARTLLIHGDADTKVPLSTMEEACNAVATCQLVAIPGGQHNMISAEKEAIIAEVAQYLHARVTGS